MAGEIIQEYGDELSNIKLTRGESGMFEVTVDGKLIYSKKQTGKHAQPGEVVGLIKRG